MILTDLQKYLARKEVASLADLSQHFHTDADLLRDMLEIMVRKGRVEKQMLERCDGCSQCPPETVEFYQWAQNKAKSQVLSCDRA